MLELQLAKFDGERFRMRHIIQRFPQQTVAQASSDHVISLQLGGGLGLERYTNGNLDGAIERLHSTTVIPFNKSTGWRCDEAVEVVHFYLDHEILLKIAKEEFGIDTRHLEIIDALGVDDEFIRRLFNLVQHEIRFPGQRNRIMLDSFDIVLACHLLRCYSNIGSRGVPGSGVDEAMQEEEKEAMERAREFIAENLNKPISMGDVAAQVGMTEFNFSRIFKWATGITPHQYLLDRRLAKARDMLTYSTEPLSAIAYDCGFSSQSHFTSTFGRRMGITPGEYRARGR
ncbi:MAG: AraC family transcriptional regulator [Pseudomonadota bacterium]